MTIKKDVFFAYGYQVIPYIKHENDDINIGNGFSSFTLTYEDNVKDKLECLKNVSKGIKANIANELNIDVEKFCITITFLSQIEL